jgi:hypothetical protein
MIDDQVYPRLAEFKQTIIAQIEKIRSEQTGHARTAMISIWTVSVLNLK